MSNFVNPSYWQQVPIATVTEAATPSSGLAMSSSHVYYANGSYFIRYNRSASYTNGGSWEKYAFSNLSLTGTGNAESLNNTGTSAYDGRYIYWAPRWCDQYVRYDTLGAFNNAGSYGIVNVSDVTTDGGLGAHVGLTILGNYVYYCPYDAAHFVRYPRSSSFVAGSFETKAKSDIASGTYLSITNDGRYIYYSPYSSGYVVRFDSQGTFTNTGSWEIVDRAAVLSFGGRGEYMVYANGYVYYGTDQSYVIRYNTSGAFGNVGSWEKATKASIGLSGSTYFGCVRGDYIYGYDGDTGKCLCFDTTQSFTSAAAWELADSSITGDTGSHDMAFGDANDNYVYYRSGTDEYIRFNGGPLDPPICWNYTAKYKGSSKLFKTSGGGSFPRNLRVPGNVDKSTGRMIDDGKEIDQDEYEIL